MHIESRVNLHSCFTNLLERAKHFLLYCPNSFDISNARRVRAYKIMLMPENFQRSRQKSPHFIIIIYKTNQKWGFSSVAVSFIGRKVDFSWPIFTQVNQSLQQSRQDEQGALKSCSEMQQGAPIVTLSQTSTQQSVLYGQNSNMEDKDDEQWISWSTRKSDNLLTGQVRIFSRDDSRMKGARNCLMFKLDVNPLQMLWPVLSFIVVTVEYVNFIRHLLWCLSYRFVFSDGFITVMNFKI